MAVSIARGDDELDDDAKKMRDDPKQYFRELLQVERAEIKQATKLIP